MSSLKERLLSDENIYLSIYSVNSYINNKELLNYNDRKKLYELNDKFNYKIISKTIKEVRTNIENIIEDDGFLKSKVYFKPKKYEAEEGKVIFRPVHTASLIEQITTIAMLNILIYKIDAEKKISISNLSRLIPNNFYGNRISTDVEVLFKPWYKQYQKYTSKANELFKKYHESQDYKWEVDLDLTNFFPSINPVSLYNYILTKLDVNMPKDDEKLIKKILEKLIFIKLENTNVNELQLYKQRNKITSNENDLYFDNKGFTIGIPQGLPHTYFLGNLCMIEIQKIYEQHIPGEMLFYVDDSVVFTNAIKDYEDFDNKIEQINRSIDKWQKDNFNIYVNSFNNEVSEYISLEGFKEYFTIEVHKAGDKSTITNILDSKDGEVFLSSLSRESSITAFDINSIYSDEESSILYNRIKIILEMIEKEIALQESKKNEDKNTREAYLKKLTRYKKFFKNRFLSLEYRKESDDSELVKKFKDKYKFLEENSDKSCKLKKFFDEYSEDVFEPTVNFVLKKLCETQKKKEIKWILERLNNINDILFDFSNTNSSYFYKTYEKYYSYIKRGKYPNIDIDKYNSLKQLVRSNIINTANKSDLAIAKLLNKKLEEISDDKSRIDYIKKILGNKLYTVISLVSSNTERIIRMILNAVFSYICQFDINDNLYLMKKNYRKITYTELRLFVYLRNERFELKKFLNLYKDFLKNDFNIGIDYSILQVIKIFKMFIKTPEKSM